MPRPIIFEKSDSTVLRMFPAGGVTRSRDWLEIAETSRQFADSTIYLNSHSSLELRNVSDSAAVIERLDATTLHTASCRVLASPLDSRSRELACLIGENIPEATGQDLIVGVDGGDGSIANEHPDVCVKLVDNATEVRVQALGKEGLVSIAEAPRAVVELLQGFSASEASPSELNGAPGTETLIPNSQLPIGWLAEHMPEGRVELGVGLFQGEMSADIAELLGKMEVPVTITPWKGLILHDLSEGDADVVVRVLAPRGLIFDVNSPFL